MDKKIELNAKIFPLQTPVSLAKRWGIDRTLVQQWKKRHKAFPKPTKGYVDGASSYYAMCDVEEYEKIRGITVTNEVFVNENIGNRRVKNDEVCRKSNDQ